MNMTRSELERATGSLLDVAGRSMRMKRIRHDMGRHECDENYRARLLAELDRCGCNGLQLIGVPC